MEDDLGARTTGFTSRPRTTSLQFLRISHMPSLAANVTASQYRLEGSAMHAPLGRGETSDGLGGNLSDSGLD